MNKDRRIRLAVAGKMIEHARGIVYACAIEEWKYVDAMPAKSQFSDRAQNSEYAASDLYEAANALDEVMGSIAGVAA